MADLARLRENEAALADALLPPDPDLTVPLDPQAQFLTHAYLVLATAVIEEFIEESFEDYVQAALDNVEPERVPPCFVPLAAKFAADLTGQTHTTPPAAEACPILRGLYSSKIVFPNNGIKRKNVSALAKPLGLQPRLESDCEDLLAATDTLGSRRGRVAHIGTISEELRPGDARKLVLDVIDELEALQTLLEN